MESVLNSKDDKKLSGIILTNGLDLGQPLLNKIKNSEIPFISSNEDSFKVTTRINKMTIKTEPNDIDKIPIIKENFKRIPRLRCN